MNKSAYLIPNLAAGAIHRTEFTVKKSRFITSIGHVSSVEEAKTFILKVSAEFADARHNCFAYNASKPGSSGYAGCSDDGEPHGTAGQPMLNIIMHSKAGELCAVVTRYFGGILLGTGGLVKAYQDSVKIALESLALTPKILTTQIKAELPMRSVNQALRLCGDLEAQIIKKDFAQHALFDILIPQDSYERFKKQLNAICSGSLSITEIKK